jgi:hypothetical protein
MVRRYNNIKSDLHGDLYITMNDARNRYKRGPKKAAAQFLAAAAHITVRAAYPKIRLYSLRNGERAYFLN